jgi:class 3 adenylate cyclase
MALADDLREQVAKTFREQWSNREGKVVPDDTSIAFRNEAVELDGVVLYADLSESTNLVDQKAWGFAAEIYKTFLHCAAKIINAENGTITAYDGDRIMAIFTDDYKNTSAIRCALKINFACKNIIQPAITAQYPNANYVLKHTIGIDRSKLHAVKTGVRGANDLVWVGRAANWAAKLCGVGNDYVTWITKSVHDGAIEKGRIAENGTNIWEERRWTAVNNEVIYRSNYWWPL